MIRRLVLAPVAFVVATGCVASKGDIRLLQDDLAVTRAQIAHSDTLSMRADEARRAQLSALGSALDRAIDSLRVASSRLANFQANTSGSLDEMGRQMVQVQALLGQNTRNLQQTRAQLEALQNAGIPASPNDTSRNAGVPGALTLFNDALDQLRSGSPTVARNGFQQLLTSYPNSDQVSAAQYWIGETYATQGNTAAADSVYTLVVNKYPKSDEAPKALFKRAQILLSANKKTEAEGLLRIIVRDYPHSDEATLAADLLKPRG